MFEYPFYGKYRLGDLIVRFDRQSEGVVVRYPIGVKRTDWAQFNFTKIYYKEKVEMQNLKKDDIIIGSQLKSGGDVSFAKHPKVQANFIIAQHEAERLAKLDTTKKFVVVKVMGVCQVQNTIWE